MWYFSRCKRRIKTTRQLIVYRVVFVYPVYLTETVSQQGVYVFYPVIATRQYIVAVIKHCIVVKAAPDARVPYLDAALDEIARITRFHAVV